MNPQNKTGPKDVFGHLLAIIGLYVSVLSFGALLFGLINLYIPDVLQYEHGRFAVESLKWPLAILVIVFPLYVWLTAYLQRDLQKNPEKKELKTRRWLLYFTLFATAVVIIGDMVTLIFRFLNGDLTLQFVFKVCAILAIAGSVFTYYVWNIRKDIPASSHSGMRWFVRGVLLAGVLLIVFGFFVAGSPFAERMKRFDERRIQNLQTLQYEIVNFWQTKETLPTTLDELRDDIRGFTPPQDPETGESYGYTVVSTNEFTLCAMFKAANKEVAVAPLRKPIPASPEGYFPAPEENWLHDAGETCFTRTIDPDRYPPFKR
ncbi:MAG: DUF5671 domain-containing protein [bacterium]|nr:DUF5671 domain-containing protein [bacterium]